MSGIINQIGARSKIILGNVGIGSDVDISKTSGNSVITVNNVGGGARLYLQSVNSDNTYIKFADQADGSADTQIVSYGSTYGEGGPAAPHQQALQFQTGGGTTALTLFNDQSATFVGGITAPASTSFNNESISIHNNRINSGYSQDTEDNDIWINYEGYNNSNTRFRDFRVGDGKNNQCLLIDGSSKAATFAGTVTTPGVQRTMVIDPKLYSKDNVYGTSDLRTTIQNDQQTIPLLPGYTIRSVMIPTATNRTSFGWTWELCKHDEYATEVVVSTGTVSNQTGNPWITMDVTDYTIEDEQRVYFRISNVSTSGGTYGYMYNWRVSYTSPTTM